MQFLLASVGVVLLSVVSSLGVYNYVCEKEISSYTKGTEYSVQIEDIIEQMTNPEFKDVNAVVSYRKKQQVWYEIDSIFESIPYETLKTVSQVVIGRNGSAAKKDLVDEYEKNYSTVYRYIKADNVPKDPPIQSGTIKVSLPTEYDTIINGKAFKLITETKSDE